MASKNHTEVIGLVNQKYFKRMEIKKLNDRIKVLENEIQEIEEKRVELLKE